MSRKIKKNLGPLGQSYQNKRLTEAEYDRLRNEVCQIVADEMVCDVLLVVLDILQHKIGKLYRHKDQRAAIFGEMFRPMLKAQSITHSMEHLPLLKQANLANLEYGE